MKSSNFIQINYSTKAEFIHLENHKYDHDTLFLSKKSEKSIKILWLYLLWLALKGQTFK